ncbi:vesicle-associated protein 1-1-like [Solanum stenotomum]|uniref:vesicle-associated protein 1-1-like n=1 Tax=Solanum stenotomum TaxID=172797 RepID=UPI0020D1800F|nr:vesicle-associated protein 1-1-like [Solanum stenotomum]XP_049382305.1 vesicle-associated protein 1-1-like [Solanum stenotomum]
MYSDLVEIAPRELKFIFEPKKQSSCTIRLINKSQNHVAFKVKTTSPKKYCVRPNTGIIKPRASCDFTVTMQAQKAPPPDMACKDKFLVQCTVVAEETVEEDITSAMFSKDDGKYVQENKMRVILVSPPGSPVLSPINVQHSDLPSYIDSPREDQVHGNENICSYQEGDVNGVHNHNGRYQESLTRDQVNPLNQNTPKELDENVKEFRKENADMQMEGKHAQLETRKHDEEMDLVKDVASMKSKIIELERKLSEAKDTISRLTEERKSTAQERESLQRELVMLTSKKGGRKVRVGFPLLYVVTVAFISMVFGYLMHY